MDEQRKIIELQEVSKEYNLRNRSIPVLYKISVSFETGKFYAIMGHSGSGKSTLINIIGLLENITNGKYFINGRDVSQLNDIDESNLRKNNIGMIFQDFYLDEYLKAYENVMLPMIINKNISNKKRKEKALKLLNIVDLQDRISHYPKELSGGEKQRIAIARALANEPQIILADEPTGNLDEENEQKIFEILKRLSESGKCVIVVSHSNEVKKYADVIYKIEQGHLTEE